MKRSAFVFVADADLNLALRVENVELSDDQRIDAIDHLCIPEDGKIEPAAAPGTPGDGAEFLAALANFAGVEVGHLRRKGPTAHARGVRLGNTEDVLDFCWRDADAGSGAARGCARRRHIGISSVIDVEHGALRALEEHGFAFV